MHSYKAERCIPPPRKGGRKLQGLVLVIGALRPYTCCPLFRLQLKTLLETEYKSSEDFKRENARRQQVGLMGAAGRQGLEKVGGWLIECVTLLRKGILVRLQGRALHKNSGAYCGLNVAVVRLQLPGDVCLQVQYINRRARECWFANSARSATLFAVVLRRRPLPRPRPRRRRARSPLRSRRRWPCRPSRRAASESSHGAIGEEPASGRGAVGVGSSRHAEWRSAGNREAASVWSGTEGAGAGVRQTMCRVRMRVSACGGEWCVKVER